MNQVLPSKYDDPDGPENRENSKGMLDLLKVPSIFLAAMCLNHKTEQKPCNQKFFWAKSFIRSDIWAL